MGPNASLNELYDINEFNVRVNIEDNFLMIVVLAFTVKGVKTKTRPFRDWHKIQVH